MCELLYGCPIQVASQCLRAMITAAPEHTLFCADFSSIEARVLAWLACEEKNLKAFREDLDLYKITAHEIYGVAYENVDKRQRLIGKVATLALGYQGWLGAFVSMAEVYGLSDKDFLPGKDLSAFDEKTIHEMAEEAQKEIILRYRRANPSIVNFWAGLEDAALKTVKTGNPYSYGRIKFGIRGNFLHCRLPSGRLLSYYNPSIAIIKKEYKNKDGGKYEVEKEVVSFWGIDSKTKKYGKQYTYGGKLCENVVSGTARDLLAGALNRIEAAGYDIVISIHDEVLAERLTGGSLEEFNNLMAFAPDWAAGLPVGAEGWKGFRYRK
jgi:DNA polymerase